MATIQGVYVALFGRPADPAGLAYFNGITNNGADLAKIGVLSGQAEYTARFSGMSNTQIITAIYQSLFNRAPEAAGLEFFANALTKGTLSINNIAIAILDGAQGADKTTVTNKLTAADNFTKALDTATEQAAYTGAGAAELGRNFLTPVGSATSSIPSAAATDAAVAGVVAGPPVSGVTITLANATDVVSASSADPALKSTAGNDTIIGGTKWDAKQNVIDAGAGTDKFSATVTGVVANNTVVTDGLKGVELAFFKADAANAVVDVANAKELTQVWADASLGTLGVQGVALSTTVGVKGDNGNFAQTFTFAGATGTTDSATLALDGATKTKVTVDAIETLNVNVVSSSTATISAADATTLKIGGTGSANLTLTAAKVDTIDASGNSGGLTTDGSGIQGLKSVVGSSAADTITVDSAGNTVDLKVDGGAGADTLIVTSSAGNGFAVSLTGGAGPDTFRIQDIKNLSANTAADLSKSLITITDFDKAVDTIDIKAATVLRDTLTGTELENIKSATSLFDAVTKAASFTDAGSLSVFAYGGDSYIFQNNGTGALEVGDGLVKVVGVSSVADFTTTNLLIATV